jgi:hypothetical protein
MPLGCYFGKKFRDEPADGEAASSMPSYREFFVLFDEKNGPKHACTDTGPGGLGVELNCEYQIVMNARANQPISIDDHLVDIYSMCSGCENPYYVLEIGEAEASKDTELVASNFAARWGENGVTLLQTDAQGDKVLNLSEKSILQFRLQGQDGQNAIKKDAIVRLYLWPLTGWNIGASDCLASCEPYEFNDKICEGQVSCIPEAVVGSSLRNNIIRLRLPTEMSDITSQTTHTISVTSMDTPAIGFFPIRMGAQLTDESDASPHYTTSDGYLMKYPA